MKVCVHQVSSELEMLLLSVIITSSLLLESQPKSKLIGWKLLETWAQTFSSILLAAGKKFSSAQALIRYLEEVNLKTRALKKTSAWFRVKKLTTLQKAIILVKQHGNLLPSLYGKLKTDRALTIQPHPLKSAHYHYLDHLLADSHECVIQFWIHHLCLL